MASEFVHADDISSALIQDNFQAFLRRCCASEIEALMLEVAVDRHYQIEVNALDLATHDMLLLDLLIHRPERTLMLFKDAIFDYQTEVLQALELAHDTMVYSMIRKPFVHARVHSLPKGPQMCKPTISCIRTDDAGRLVCLTGTVTRAAAVRMLHSERKVECAKCGHPHVVRAELERRNEIVLPAECGHPLGARTCTSNKFNDLEGSEVCVDYQELRVQEQVQKLGIGSIPRSMTVVLENDLVDRAKPGDDVLITGIVVRRWRPVRVDGRVDVELVILANHVTVCNQLSGAGLVTDEACRQFGAYWERHGRGYGRFAGRDLLLHAVCPDLRGLFILKLALVLTLLGGVTRVNSTGQKVRGESHLLMIGDPGTGKSQVLKFAAALSARSVVTTGIGSTSAGLTVTATKDATGEWSLDAGALVLADGGVCCIDEFETMKESDRTTIHEAMEQQTLSVAKAGLVCKLRTKTTILAATNPSNKSKGGPDAALDLSADCGIASPLLSRFDIILLLRDEYDPGFDSVIADFILNRDRKRDSAGRAGEEQRDGLAGLVQQQDEHAQALLDAGADEQPGGSPRIASAELRGSRTVVEGGDCWDERTLRAYLECARRTFNPVMSSQAEAVLGAYFERQRQAEGRHVARTTIRLLESLIRLSQAHARLMWRNVVVVSDAVYAIAMIEAGASWSVDGPLSMRNVLRSEIPHRDCSGGEAEATVRRVCQWLNISVTEDDEEWEAEAEARQRGDGDDGGRGQQRAQSPENVDAQAPALHAGDRDGAWRAGGFELQAAEHQLPESTARPPPSTPVDFLGEDIFGEPGSGWG